MKRINMILLYPFMLIASSTLCYKLINSVHSIERALIVTLVISNILVWVYEFIYPFEESWKPTKKILVLDIAHTLISARIVTPLIKILIIYLITKFQFLQTNLWPHELPVILQVILAIISSDFMVYTFHRWMHKTNLGWRIHVVHHTPSKLHFWASARAHPINVGITFFLEVGLLIFLGIDAEVLAVWTVYMSINGLFQHCNIDIKPGVLNKFLATCEVHRIHHSTNWDESNSNFGTTTVLWDRLFGTYKEPTRPIENVGIMNHVIPENYWDQLKSPFLLNKYKSGLKTKQ